MLKGRAMSFNIVHKSKDKAILICMFIGGMMHIH